LTPFEVGELRQACKSRGIAVPIPKKHDSAITFEDIRRPSTRTIWRIIREALRRILLLLFDQPKILVFSREQTNEAPSNYDRWFSRDPRNNGLRKREK